MNKSEVFKREMLKGASEIMSEKNRLPVGQSEASGPQTSGMEDVYLAERRQEAILVMEQFLPNRCRSHQHTIDLYDAILAGKVPTIGISY